MKSKIKVNKFKVAAVILFLIAVVLYVLIYVAPKFLDAFVESYTAEFSTLDVDQTIDYLCVRDERVHTADAAGSVKRVAKAGSLKRNGAVIVKVGGVSYHAQMRGIVSFNYDGLEKQLTSERLGDLTEKSLHPVKDDKGKMKNRLRKCSKGSVVKGDPVFKMVDNSAWYLVTWVDAASAEAYRVGSGVTVEFDDKDKTQVRFSVYSSEAQEYKEAQAAAEGKEASEISLPEDKNYKVILKCDRHYKRFSRLRYGTCRVILSQKTGIVLETSSITEEDGKKGVYVKNKYGDYVFTRISIIAEVGDKTVVESRTFYIPETDEMVPTVKNYDSIKKGDGSGNVD